MRAENIGIWNRQHFWCGAFDVNSLKVVEVHKYEEAEDVDFNSYWCFNKVTDSCTAEDLFEKHTWEFFWVDKRNGKVTLNLQAEAEVMNPTAKQIIYFEGVKALIKKQISIGDPKVVNNK